jgi:hypothetical protein
MILDNFIVEQVIGLVDGAEHSAAASSVSVLTTAPAMSQGQRDRAASVAGNIAHSEHAQPDCGTSWPSRPVCNQAA